jgi:uncharacterized protein YndB with AHSA1/START domain
MPETLLTSTTSFSVSRIIDAPREAVFDAFTDPVIMRQWYSPDGFSTPAVDSDPRAGGAYRIGMKQADGEIFYVAGKFTEVRRPEKLVFTWAWEEDDGPGHESVVTVEFKSRDSKTEVILTQERLAGAESRDKHIHGWTGILDKLMLLAPKLKG